MNLSDKLINTFESKLDVFSCYLSKGATDENLDKLIEVTRLKIPDALAELYKITNGEGNPDIRYGIGLGIFGFKLMSIDSVILEWERFKDWDDDCRPVYQKDLLKENVFNPKRLPFASDGAGQFLCIDFDPASDGREGQIIYLPTGESEPACVISNNFDEFLLFIIQAVESGTLKLVDERDEWDEDEWEEWREEDNSDLSDVDICFEKSWRDDWSDVANLYDSNNK